MTSSKDDSKNTDELHDILKPLSDGGYHNNSEDKTRSTCYDCKRIDSAKSKLTKYIEQEINKAEIRAKIEMLDKAIMGAGEYHDDPYEYVVPIKHLKEYRAGLKQFDLTQPVFKERRI